MRSGDLTQQILETPEILQDRSHLPADLRTVEAAVREARTITAEKLAVYDQWLGPDPMRELAVPADAPDPLVEARTRWRRYFELGAPRVQASTDALQPFCKKPVLYFITHSAPHTVTILDAEIEDHNRAVLQEVKRIYDGECRRIWRMPLSMDDCDLVIETLESALKELYEPLLCANIPLQEHIRQYQERQAVEQANRAAVQQEECSRSPYASLRTLCARSDADRADREQREIERYDQHLAEEQRMREEQWWAEL